MENFKGVEALSTTEKNRNHPTREPNRGKRVRNYTNGCPQKDQRIFSKKKIRKSDSDLFDKTTWNSRMSTSFPSFAHKLKQNNIIFNPTVIVRDYAYTTEKYIAYNNAAVTEYVTERNVDVPKSVELTTSQQLSEEGNMLAFIGSSQINCFVFTFLTKMMRLMN